MKKVAIIEGFSGGSLFTKPLRSELSKSFEITRKSGEADIIIAHSAGCHGLPKHIKASLLVFIDPPYWPDSRLGGRFVENWRTIKHNDIQNFGRLYYQKKRLLQAYYAIVRAKYLWLGISRNNDTSFIDLANQNRKMILVRNLEDSYCGPQLKELASHNPHVKYYELPGVHDDLIMNPRPYVELLRKEL